MQDRLARHFLPAEALVLGTRLQPFTLWHWRTLAALGCGMLHECAESPDFEDLALAVRICALPPHASPRALRRAMQPGPLDRLRLAFHRNYADFGEALGAWYAYFSHHSAGPKPLDTPDGHSARTHPTIFLVAGLMQLGYSRADAWAETPGMARWFIAGGIEAAGDQLQIVSDAMIADAFAAGYTEEEMGL
ncbi:MAG: hypothetical protein ABMA13_18385 [Chthoniobacteraceae bacterium]